MFEQSTLCFMCNFYVLLVLVGALVVYLIGSLVAAGLKGAGKSMARRSHVHSTPHGSMSAFLRHSVRHHGVS